MKAVSPLLLVLWYAVRSCVSVGRVWYFCQLPWGVIREYNLENIMGTHDDLPIMLCSLQRIGTASHEIFSVFSSKSVLLRYLWHLFYWWTPFWKLPDVELVEFRELRFLSLMVHRKKCLFFYKMIFWVFSKHLGLPTLLLLQETQGKEVMLSIFGVLKIDFIHVILMKRS